MHTHPFIAALIGGLLIGLSVSLVALWLGKIAGISGIVALSGRGHAHETDWRRAFLVGLLLAPLAWQYWQPLPEMRIAASEPRLILAGLLVGFGTRLGAGCTSGHGVCGLARLSPRSLVATLLFMLTAVLVANLVQ